jgi:cytochrome c-type biogenesis protein
MTLEDLQEGGDHRVVLLHSLLFVAGFSAVFIVLGAGASYLGVFFRVYNQWIARVGGALIIVLGLHLLGVFRLSALMRERRVHLADKPEGKLGTLAVGAAFGAGWTPCIGPILGAILTMAGAADTMWAGVGLLSVYSLGLAVPFLIAALALQWFLGTYKRFRRFVPLMEKASGALLVLLGILLVTDAFTILSSYLVKLTPGFILERI